MAGNRQPTGIARAVVVLGACLVVLVELERLVSGAVSPSGLSRSLSGLLGPGALAERSSWDVWAASASTDVVVRVLLAHVLVDLGFVAAYAFLLRRWGRFLRVWTERSDTLVRIVTTATAVLVVTDVVEDALLVLAAGLLHGGSVPAWAAVVLAVVTTGKWLALLVVVLASWVAARRRFGTARSVASPLARVRGTTLSIVRAVLYQRLSLLVVVLVGVLSVVPGPNIWDQLPDIQRRWVDAAPADLVHLALALVGTFVLALQLFVLGRRRSERAWATWKDGSVPAERTPWWLWVAWPLLSLAVVAVLLVTGHREDIDLQPLLLFLGVFVVLILSSVLLQRSRFAPRPVDSRATDEARARHVWIAGDSLAGAVLVLAGLGLVRSFTAPLVLRPLAPDPGSLAAAVADGALLGWSRWAAQLVLWLGGLALAVWTPSLVRWLVRHVDDKELPPPEAPGLGAAMRRLLCPRRVGGLATHGAQQLVPALVWGAGGAVLLLFALMPLQVAPAVGVVFTLQAVLGAWVVVIGFAVVRLQESQPLALFRLLRLRSTPVVTLLILVPLLASQRGGDPDLHAVRQITSTAAVSAEETRPDVTEALDAWVGGSAACDRPGANPDDPAVRPVLLVAAAGGGIRAATWTADVLSVLGDSTCGRVATLLSSGVSGGSVGLALGREGDPVSAAGDLSGPAALSAAIAGLFVGDLLAGSTGVRAPAAGTGGRWLDRAGLMETTWERQAPSLADRFDAETGGVGGTLVLNSTAAGPGCRVLVSQVSLGSARTSEVAPQSPEYDPALAPTGAGDEPNCLVRSGLPPVSLDMQDVYGACTPDITWASASMLSARFPTVTPAGRIPASERRQADGTVLDCSGPAERAPLQLVDGGYAEGSGLGTLSDLAPDLMSAIRTHNAAAATSSGEPLLAPVVVLLSNASRSDLATPQPALSSELLVPLAGLGAKGLQTDDITWLQRLSGELAQACPEPATASCRAAQDAVQGPLTGGVVVVAPQTEPAVDAPLGWTLSVDSRVRLADAVTVQADPACVDRPRPGGYACLGQLLEVLDG